MKETKSVHPTTSFADALLRAARSSILANRKWISEGDLIPPGAKIIRTEECWGQDGRCKCSVLPCRWTVVEMQDAGHSKSVPHEIGLSWIAGIVAIISLWAKSMGLPTPLGLAEGSSRLPSVFRSTMPLLWGLPGAVGTCLSVCRKPPLLILTELEPMALPSRINLSRRSGKRPSGQIRILLDSQLATSFIACFGSTMYGWTTSYTYTIYASTIPMRLRCLGTGAS